MNPNSHPPALLSIGALSRETGVPVTTLRTWERRYGFPVPERLESGHRRYPYEHVERLRLIRAALEAGHRPVKTVPAPLADLRMLLGTSAPVAVELPGRPSHWLDLVRNFEADALEQELRAAWARFGLPRFVLECAAPFMFEIGELWSTGDLDVKHEHFASEELRDFLSSRWRPMNEACRGPSVLCATLPGEQHNLGLHMAAVLLTHHDLRVIFLGSDTPTEQIAPAVFHSGGSAVLIGSSPAADHKELLKAVRALRRMLPPRVDLLVGGSSKALDIEHVSSLGSLAALTGWAGDFRNTGARPAT